ncbi:MAG: transposase [Cytophagales bacterium]|nr:transposase [Cytophagales bacterium]
MANTYTQIHIQLIFAIQNRQSLISKDWKDELYRYITGIIHNRPHKASAINGMPAHLHLLYPYFAPMGLFHQRIKAYSTNMSSLRDCCQTMYG